MANQYYNALHYAAEDLKADLKKYGIEIDSSERMIVWRESAVPVKVGTTKRECLRILRRIISAEKRLATEKQLEQQARLL